MRRQACATNAACLLGIDGAAGLFMACMAMLPDGLSPL